MAEDPVFWVTAPIMVLAALGLLFGRKPIHIAMGVVTVMVGLAILYFNLDAPFLGAVQIVVYTGAVMMLFLFVLMLVGVDSEERLRDNFRGHWAYALVAAAGLGLLLFTALGRVSVSTRELRANQDTNPDAVADELFAGYVIHMEILGILLITAAVGALVLTHVPRLRARRTQKQLQAARIAQGADPVNKPMPGVYARHNALDAPALDPDGNPIEDSVSRVLKVRGQTKSVDDARGITEGDDK